MHCLRVIAGTSACLDIVPGGAGVSPCTQTCAPFCDLLSLSALFAAFWLFRSPDRPDLTEDPRFRTNADRLKHLEKLDATVQNIAGQHTPSSKPTLFAAAQVRVGLAYDVIGFCDDPHGQARGVLVELVNAELGNLPMHVLRPCIVHAPGVFRRPAADLDQHDDGVLALLPIGDVSKHPQTFRLVACNSATAASCSSGDQHERR